MTRSRRDLAAAGISDPRLQADYERSRQLNARHGKTYYLATLLLPPAKRPYVHALYGFARHADDIVDDDAPDRDARFTTWHEGVLADLDWGDSGDPATRALIDTLARWDIPASYVADFLDSMRMDLTVREYATYDELAHYMWGSAAVIGLQMLPILGRADQTIPTDTLESHAADLGVAFQLTNFLRDVGEDLARGRVYLPQDSLRIFGVDRRRLELAAHTGRVDEPIRNLLAHEIARTRALYLSAEPGIDLVHAGSQPCLRTAFTLYGGILEEIEQADYNVFDRRVRVGLRRRATVAARGLVSARAARSGGPATPSTPASTSSWRTRTAGLRRGRR